MIAREDAAWLAGLLDGEGCIDMPRGNPRLRIKMSDHDVVLRAAHLMDARTHMETVEGRLPLLVAQVTGDRARSVLRDVLPWLGARRTTRATEVLMSRGRATRHPRVALQEAPAA